MRSVLRGSVRLTVALAVGGALVGSGCSGGGADDAAPTAGAPVAPAGPDATGWIDLNPEGAAGRPVGGPASASASAGPGGGGGAPGAEGSGGRDAVGPTVADEGAELWAIVLAGASEPGDPLLQGVVADALAAGHVVSPTNCDRGAAEAIRMDPASAYTVSAYADSEGAAATLRDELEAAGLSGVVALVRVACPL